MINILIADDQQIIYEGLKGILSKEKDLKIVGYSKNGIEVLERLDKLDVDIVLLDINMPEMDGLEASKRISKKYPFVRVLVLSMYNKPEYIRQVMDAGAHGYAIKNIPKNELINAIKTVNSGLEYYSTEIKDTIVQSLKTKGHVGDSYLTDRERDIIRLLADGHTTVEIATKLVISTHTVDTHRKNLMNKLDKKNIASLVKYAVENGYAGSGF